MKRAFQTDLIFVSYEIKYYFTIHRSFYCFLVLQIHFPGRPIFIQLPPGHLDGVFMHKKAQKLKFLCERNDKVFFSSAKGGSSCQIYFMTLNKPGMANW